jgi:Baseplate J-like protein
MGAQYRCKNQDRRLKILHPPSGLPVNGIDFVEVLDHDAFPGTPRQQTLLVRLFRPVPGTLSAANLRIDGGVRTVSVPVEWAQPASAVTRVPPAEAAFYAALPAPDHVLVVRTRSAGDFSIYRLALVTSADDATPPPLFDPVLSSVELSFKVQCPTDFDCAEVTTCPPASAPSPVIDYLAKDYASFRRVLLDRLSVVVPDWKERNPADPAIAAVEILAYAADHLSYFQDSVATEAYLGTARRRVSVRRHARLLDYRMHEGVNARAFVCLETKDDATVVRQRVGNQVTALLSRCGDEPVIHPDALPELLLEHRPQVFEPMHDLALYVAHNQIELHTWGDSDCCLPRGATRATLRDGDTAEKRLRLVPGDVLVLEERLGARTGLEADADPTRRHAVRVTRVTPAASVATDDSLVRTPAATPLTDPVTGEAIVEIEWAAEDALPFPLCVSTVLDQRPLAGITVARGNVVLADHGQTVLREPLVPATVPAEGRYRPRLARAEITHRVKYEDERARREPAARALVQDAHRAEPAVTLVARGEEWSARVDLLESDRFARDFVVEMDEDGRATLRFGDGVLARAPENDLVASYRVGRGRAGNVGRGAIAHLVMAGARLEKVRNPLPARGGVDPESIQDVKLFAPQAFRRQERAVTEADYAAIAERHPDVQKAVATRRWTGSWYTVFVAVDRKGGRALDPGFRDELLEYLERFRLAGQDLELEPPVLVPLELRLVVCVKPGYFRDQVRHALFEAFAAGDLPDGRRGFFHPDNFSFAQPLHLSQVVNAAMQVPGVEWVDPTDPGFRFQRFGERPNRELENGVLPMGRLEIARLDNSPSLPENGRLDFQLAGGQ